MLIARVVGEMVATRKHPSHEGRNLLLVQPLELDGSNRGDAVIAMDAIGAGVGDKVLLTTDGYAAMSCLGLKQSPIDMAVIGFIDRVDLVTPRLELRRLRKKAKNRLLTRAAQKCCPVICSGLTEPRP